MRGSITFRNKKSSVAVPARLSSEYAYRRLKALWRRCAQEFFAAASLRVARNIDTGMSMASMMPLAAKVYATKALTAALAASAHSPKKGYRDISGVWHSEGYRSIAQGKREGSNSENKITYGTVEAPLFEFKFIITVFQFALHERGLANVPAWEAIEAGKIAFMETWRTQLANYVSARDLIDVINNGTYARNYYKAGRD